MSESELLHDFRFTDKQFDRLQWRYFWWEALMDNTAEMAAGRMMSIPNSMLIDSGTQELWRPMPQELQKLQCWYYRWAWLIVYAFAIISVDMIHTPKLMTIGSGIQVLLKLLPITSIKRRLNSGNACYHSVQNVFSTGMLSKNIKIRIYESMWFCVGVKICVWH
jgi:hypothetical protein